MHFKTIIIKLGKFVVPTYILYVYVKMHFLKFKLGPNPPWFFRKVLSKLFIGLS